MPSRISDAGPFPGESPDRIERAFEMNTCSTFIPGWKCIVDDVPAIDCNVVA
jgi:hypothetical protein